jgi:hypothetical protein
MVTTSRQCLPFWSCGDLRTKRFFALISTNVTLKVHAGICVSRVLTASI